MTLGRATELGEKSVGMINPQLFIAHSSADKELVRHLAMDLIARDISVWFDEWEIRVGHSLMDKIESGITNVESTIKNDDVNAIRLSLDELKKIAEEMSKAIYANIKTDADAEAGSGGAPEDAGPSDEPQPQEGEDVIDAEFEVKE